MIFEAVVGPRARWVLDRVGAEDLALLIRCIVLLEHQPFPDAVDLVPLVIPGEPVYPQAYRCGRWAIVFEIVDGSKVFIQVIGRRWPPTIPTIR